MSWNNSIGLGGLSILEKLGKVPIYTFGFGKNIKKVTWWLDTITKFSLGGTFSFVPDGASLTAAISQLLGGLLTVVAQDVEFILTPARDHPPDLRKATVVDYTYTSTYKKIKDEATGVTRIRFGNLFSGESRKIVVSMTLLDRALPPCGTMPSWRTPGAATLPRGAWEGTSKHLTCSRQSVRPTRLLPRTARCKTKNGHAFSTKEPSWSHR